jgi:hypothetical protein
MEDGSMGGCEQWSWFMRVTMLREHRHLWQKGKPVWQDGGSA